MYTITERRNGPFIVPRKALRIKEGMERTITNASLRLSLWTGKRIGALAFSLSPTSPREPAVVLAQLREAILDANTDMIVLKEACESTHRSGFFQFSFRKIHLRDQ